MLFLLQLIITVYFLIPINELAELNSEFCYFGKFEEKTKQSYCSIVAVLPSNDKEAFKTEIFNRSDEQQAEIMNSYCASEEQVQLGVMNYLAENREIMRSQFFTCCTNCLVLRKINSLDRKFQLIALKVLFMMKAICIQMNYDFGFCEKFSTPLSQTWFSCPGLYSNQIVSYPFYAPCTFHLDSYSTTNIYAGFAIYAFLDQSKRKNIFGTYDIICNPYRFGSQSDQTLSKSEFISDGHCITRYKNNDYEIHCCCYWRFRHNCTIPLDGEMHICANRSKIIENGVEEIINTTLQSLPLASSCFTSFELNITDKETVHLIDTSYGVPTNTHQCYQYISESHSTRCFATESCPKMCPLVEPFPVNVSQTLKVLCCCDNREDNMCNIKTEFGQSLLINGYELTKCAYRHVLQHIFSADIYASNCIVYYDFSLMKPLNLIYGYNMEFERPAEEIYSSKEELIVADIFEQKNHENTWTKCCTEINASEAEIDRITKAVKAWTVGVLKCNGNIEPRCDANLIEKIDNNRTYYFDYYKKKYGRLCYLKDYIDQEVTQNRSLETTWCYEETYGRGLDFVNRRDFMLEDKMLPTGKICAHRLKTKIRYFNNTMFAYCFMKTQDNGETSTICCCTSTVDKPCNFISEKYHIGKTSVYYSKKILQKREYCLSLDGTRDICSLATGHKVVCYYIADMKNGKVEGGCAQPLTKKFERHKLANICLINALYNLGVPIEFLHAAEAVKVFCCAGRDDCKESVMEMRRFKRLFESERSKTIKTLKEKDFAFISSR